MEQSGKTTSRSRKPKTSPVVVSAAPALVEQALGVELLAPNLRLLPVSVDLEVRKLKTKIDDFIGSMAPITDSIFAHEPHGSEISSIDVFAVVGSGIADFKGFPPT